MLCYLKHDYTLQKADVHFRLYINAHKKSQNTLLERKIAN